MKSALSCIQNVSQLAITQRDSFNSISKEIRTLLRNSGHSFGQVRFFWRFGERCWHLSFTVYDIYEWTAAVRFRSCSWIGCCVRNSNESPEKRTVQAIDLLKTMVEGSMATGLAMRKNGEVFVISPLFVMRYRQ